MKMEELPVELLYLKPCPCISSSFHSLNPCAVQKLADPIKVSHTTSIPKTVVQNSHTSFLSQTKKQYKIKPVFTSLNHSSFLFSLAELQICINTQ